MTVKKRPDGAFFRKQASADLNRPKYSSGDICLPRRQRSIVLLHKFEYQRLLFLYFICNRVTDRPRLYFVKPGGVFCFAEIIKSDKRS